MLARMDLVGSFQFSGKAKLHQHRGFAALECGKPLPYRDEAVKFEAVPRSDCRGVASADNKERPERRKPFRTARRQAAVFFQG